jgi:hypothetical protein
MNVFILSFFTVAKIQLVSSKELGIFEVEVFTYNKKLKTLETIQVMKINPSLKRNYMFFVCIISWKGLYPIGIQIFRVWRINCENL